MPVGLLRSDRPAIEPAELLRRRLGANDTGPVDAWAQMLGVMRAHAAGTELCRYGGPCEPPLMVFAGWIGETRFLSDGRRQFVGLRLPGDFLGMGQQPQPFATLALTAVETVEIRPGAGWTQGPLHAAWEAARDVEQARRVDHILRLGRLSAMERTAHLFLELHARLAAVGLATAQAFRLPLTQEILADLLGLSIVHMNRTLKQLRQEGLIRIASGTVTLLERERLTMISSYSQRFGP